VTPIGVHTALVAYRAAVGQLARSTRLVGDPAGAVCAIGGEDGWCGRAAALLDAGALTVLVADPVAPALVHLDELIRHGGDVVLERPRMRPAHAVRGEAADAVIVSATCASVPGRAVEVAQDLVGWLRMLTGEPIAIEAAAVAAGGAFVASGRSLGGVPVSFTISTTADGGPAIEALAIAERRIELRFDEAAGVRSAARADVDGVTMLSLGYETDARAALRRAVVGETGDEVSDLDDLRHDVRAVESVRRLAGHKL
jgi:hypothetical protein